MHWERAGCPGGRSGESVKGGAPFLFPSLPLHLSLREATMALAWPRLDCGGLGQTGRPRAHAGSGAPGWVGCLREGGSRGQQGRGPGPCSWRRPFSRLAGWFRPGRPLAGWNPSRVISLRRGASSVAGRKGVERAWTRLRPHGVYGWFMAIKRDLSVLESDLEEGSGVVGSLGRGKRRPGPHVYTGIAVCSMAGATLVTGAVGAEGAASPAARMSSSTWARRPVLLDIPAGHAGGRPPGCTPPPLGSLQ